MYTVLVKLSVYVIILDVFVLEVLALIVGVDVAYLLVN